MMPAYVLKRMILGEKAAIATSRDPRIIDSVAFMAEKLEQLSQQELASRLTLNCMNCYVEPQRLFSMPITLIDVSSSSRTHCSF